MSEPYKRYQATEGAPAHAPPDIHARLNALSQQLKAAVSQPTEEALVTVAAAHTELRKLPADTLDPLLVECLLDVAQFFYTSGHGILALDPAQAAVQLARRIQDPSRLRRALTVYGVILGDSGNLPAAVESYAEALDLALALEQPLAICSVLNNLAAVLSYGGHYREALTHFEHIERLTRNEPELAPMRWLALGNIATVCVETEDYARGLDAAREAMNSTTPANSANEQFNFLSLQFTYCQLLLETGDLAQAERQVALIKNLAQKTYSRRAELLVALTDGMYAVYSGDAAGGAARLENCLEQARTMKVLTQGALLSLLRAYEVSGRSKMALVHLRDLLVYTKQTFHNKALEHHHHHLKRLGQQVTAPPSDDNPEEEARTEIRAQLAILHRQAIAAELGEDPSGAHTYRVGKLAALLAAEDGCDAHTCFMVEMAARLHDIGKLGIPDTILAKRGPMTPQERMLMRSHAAIGAELLAQGGLAVADYAADAARHHHEHFDGSGYPDGLVGAAIPRVAQYTALADNFDAMTHFRSYRPALSPLHAITEIESRRGKQFDPHLTDLFLNMVQRLRREHPSLDEFLGAEAQNNSFIQARQKIAQALKRVGTEHATD